jgi:hypothetical protein
MSAERGWIGEPQEPREWHTPSWSERVGGDGGQHFITPESARLRSDDDLDVEDNDCTPPGNR